MSYKRRNTRQGFDLGPNYPLTNYGHKACLRTKFHTPILGEKTIPVMLKESFSITSTEEKFKEDAMKMNKLFKCLLTLLVT